VTAEMKGVVTWPGAEPSCFDAGEDKSQQFAERRRVHGDNVAELAATVAQVLAVDDTAWQTGAFSRLIVLMQEVHLHHTASRQTVNLYSTSTPEKPLQRSMRYYNEKKNVLSNRPRWWWWWWTNEL